MKNKELQTIAQNSNNFKTVYEKLSACCNTPIETATYVYTQLMSQSEYSITQAELFEVSVKEWQRKEKI